MKRIRVIFIASFPRSGSTLLERLLAELGSVAVVGEGRRVWERGFANNELCSCGHHFCDCPFWSDVREVARRSGAIDPAETRVLGEEAIPDRPGLASMRRSKRIDPRRLTAYKRELSILYASIAHVSGRSTIVDSSKDMSYGSLLGTLPGVDMTLVHLVRDPRAVAYSWQRKRRRPEITDRVEYMPTISPAGTAVGWMRRNIAIELASRRSTGPHRVRYEDLVANSLTVVPRLLGGADNNPSELVGNPSGVPLGSYHSASGNPMRLDRGPLKVAADSEWELKMKMRDRALILALAFPGILRYGYLRSAT